MEEWDVVMSGNEFSAELQDGAGNPIVFNHGSHRVKLRCTGTARETSDSKNWEFVDLVTGRSMEVPKAVKDKYRLSIREATT